MSGTELNNGLEGITVAETCLSHIDGEAGELVIGGFPVEELAMNAAYEESVSTSQSSVLTTATANESLSKLVN